MVEQHVLLADRREDVALEVLHPLRHALGVGVEEQLRPLLGDQLAQVLDADDAVDVHHLVAGDAQFVGDHRLQVGGRPGGDLEADHLAPAAALEGGLELPHQVLGLLLHFQVAVAQHLEEGVAGEAVAGEQAVDEELEEFFEGQVSRLALAPVVEADEAAHLLGDRQERVQRLVVGETTELEGQREPLVGDEGERVGRVDGERGHHREHLLEEMLLDQRHVGLGQRPAVEHHDPLGLQGLDQLAPDHLLAGHQGAGVLVDLLELLGGGEAVGGLGVEPAAHQAAQAGDADRVELVEVAAGDRQEAQALQQRVVGVLRLLEHAPVEAQPAELAVDEPLRPLGVEGQAVVVGGRAGRVEEIGSHDAHPSGFR